MNNQLETHGYLITTLNLPPLVRELVKQEDWTALDSLMFEYTAPGGLIFETMAKYCDVKIMEFIISLRESKNEWEEDGIWHDDGSRILAFSLSLTTDAPEGGVLEIRKKNTELSEKIKTPKWGNMIIFKTGIHGFEHKINKVEAGRRLIIAGWCS
ncbi:2OG-Fe(II) oxygenase [Bacteriovorax sp. Seq25_V]|uniref:2OG-Fe(II) oxygenase n=1 Tax=Bacteriovorax sp. Seq25_V TaxID=1201288 RepID=UPI00038A0F0F|nr:2OG-Fe(II) oxygenase [Bacteriovorax sp. Seq25_V]EQC43848.1 2OG-Fe(II) oxygenase family protein [Bacteriovorax sp. Seq25_V]